MGLVGTSPPAPRFSRRKILAFHNIDLRTIHPSFPQHCTLFKISTLEAVQLDGFSGKPSASFRLAFHSVQAGIISSFVSPVFRKAFPLHPHSLYCDSRKQITISLPWEDLRDSIDSWILQGPSLYAVELAVTPQPGEFSQSSRLARRAKSD